MPNIRVFSSADEVAWQAANLTTRHINATQESSANASFALAGGSLPPRAFEEIVSNFSNEADWGATKFLIGDERCVPLDHHDSSWLPAIPMMDALSVPEVNRLRPFSDREAEFAAEEYSLRLESEIGVDSSGSLNISVIWLGMGEDGHTLSLFPNHPSSSPTSDLVIPVHDSPKPPPDRITLTERATSGASLCLALITGSGKAPIMARILEGDSELPIVSVSRAVEANGGVVIWLIDGALSSAIGAPIPESL